MCIRDRTSRQTEDRKSTRTRQKNKRGDSKVESNDSPEIPDRGETSDIPSFPSGEGGGDSGHGTNLLKKEGTVKMVQTC